MAEGSWQTHLIGQLIKEKYEHWESTVGCWKTFWHFMWTTAECMKHISEREGGKVSMMELLPNNKN